MTLARRYATFWIGSLVATTGANLSLAASLMNLFRIQKSSSPILGMMLLEALVPLLMMSVVTKSMNRMSMKPLFLLASLFGVLGGLIQSKFVESVWAQMAGISFMALASTWQKPLMLQFAARVTSEGAIRSEINGMVTLIQYLGLLLGYLSSGYLVSQFGYAFCFFVNACTYFAFALFVLKSPLEIQSSTNGKPGDFMATVEVTSSDASKKHTSILWVVYGLTALAWMTGGSINVLEVEFAMGVMKLNELQISRLFFASSLGAILFGLFSERVPWRVSLRDLWIATFIVPFFILFYVWHARIPDVYPALFLYGFFLAFHGFTAMSLLQKWSAANHLARDTVRLNTLTQVATLLSAAGGIVASQYFGARLSIVLFCFMTLIGVLVSAIPYISSRRGYADAA